MTSEESGPTELSPAEVHTPSTNASRENGPLVPAFRRQAWVLGVWIALGLCAFVLAVTTAVLARSHWFCQTTLCVHNLQTLRGDLKRIWWLLAAAAALMLAFSLQHHRRRRRLQKLRRERERAYTRFVPKEKARKEGESPYT
jgi:hypothetical protein